MRVIRFRPHLVILDASMPGADGDVVCRAIKENETLKDIRILVFSGYPEEGKKLLELGADKFIEKGSKEADPEPFRRTVCNLLGVRYTKVIAGV